MPKYKDKYPDCKGCPVLHYCGMLIANSKVICENMTPLEELEEEYYALMEAGVVDHYDCY